ncbi:MAG: hypothetical protein D6785_08955 [Planctomycetota bacterium]|nr:MAG: hypothetical protein D6785_08955 [Planctomycetota bacterium]
MEPQTKESHQRLKKLSFQLLFAMLGIFLLAIILTYILKDSIFFYSKLFVENLGLYGVFFGVLFTDTSLLPLTHEPIVFLGISGGISPYILLITSSSASILAGILGYCLGRALGKTDFFERLQKRMDPRVRLWIENYGLISVGVGAFTPLPFAPTTWTAGAFRLPFRPFLLVCFFRIPREIIFIWLMVQGWNLGGSL